MFNWTMKPRRLALATLAVAIVGVVASFIGRLKPQVIQLPNTPVSVRIDSKPDPGDVVGEAVETLAPPSVSTPQPPPALFVPVKICGPLGKPYPRPLVVRNLTGERLSVKSDRTINVPWKWTHLQVLDAQTGTVLYDQDLVPSQEQVVIFLRYPTC